jgi:hypothetical protein
MQSFKHHDTSGERFAWLGMISILGKFIEFQIIRAELISDDGKLSAITRTLHVKKQVAECDCGGKTRGVREAATWEVETQPICCLRVEICIFNKYSETLVLDKTSLAS